MIQFSLLRGYACATFRLSVRAWTLDQDFLSAIFSQRFHLPSRYRPNGLPQGPWLDRLNIRSTHSVRIAPRCGSAFLRTVVRSAIGAPRTVRFLLVCRRMLRGPFSDVCTQEKRSDRRQGISVGLRRTRVGDFDRKGTIRKALDPRDQVRRLPRAGSSRQQSRHGVHGPRARPEQAIQKGLEADAIGRSSRLTSRSRVLLRAWSSRP
jgi:hypothetical protein